MNYLKNIFGAVFYFFPFQLTFLQFRRNYLLLASWIFLFAVVFGKFGSSYGIPSLFLIPEYLNKVGMFSFFLLGVSVGIFIMAYHISVYVSGGYLFPFLSTMRYPFWKFSINNSIIPLLFILIYLFETVQFQRDEQLISHIHIILHCSVFLVGVFIFMFISFAWFFTANIDISKFIPDKIEDDSKNQNLITKILDSDAEWKIYNTPKEKGKYWKVKTYLSSPFRIKRARLYSHYKNEHIQSVLRVNYRNGVYFSIAVLLLIFIIGVFKDSRFVMIPAAASINIFLSMLILLVTALFSMFKDWTLLIVIVIFFGLNIISKHSSLEYHQSAYGLNYDINPGSLKADNGLQKEKDLKDIINILNARKKKLKKHAFDSKVPIVFINTTGGGLRSTLWTYVALHYADSITNGKLLDHTQLITGASGGMLGAAYLRELYLRNKNNEIEEWYSDSLIDDISKDILNPVAFTMASSDWFLRFQNFEYNGRNYYKDRAYIWEKTLNYNTSGIMDKSLVSYSKPESEALIPMIIFSPSEVDNGRKILISSQNLSFFENYSQTGLFRKKRSVVNIDFRKQYKQYDADSLRFLSAIRMSSTFPYVSPFVTLPGKDNLKIMDAGLHDNYGLSTSLEFISIFREWFKRNSDNIIFVQILFRDKASPKGEPGLLSSITSPFSGILENFFTFQAMNFEKQVILMDTYLKDKINFVNIVCESDKDISISWRLTEEEKRIILDGVNSENNKEAFNTLKEYLE